MKAFSKLKQTSQTTTTTSNQVINESDNVSYTSVSKSQSEILMHYLF